MTVVEAGKHQIVEKLYNSITSFSNHSHYISKCMRFGRFDELLCVACYDEVCVLDPKSPQSNLGYPKMYVLWGRYVL
jgi:hypothetical protein